jgi:SAM-dependent methyltransferase
MTDVRTSLEVGFPGGELPARYAPLRGRVWRSADRADELPFEDAQFEVVILDGASVSREAVREAHRVLRTDGRLYFTVFEKSGATTSGYSLPEIYSLVRDGFHIVGVNRPSRWLFWRRDRTVTICAKKKNWKSHAGNSYRPYL